MPPPSIARLDEAQPYRVDPPRARRHPCATPRLRYPSPRTLQGSPSMLIDTHAHVSDPKFNPDRDEVLARAEAAGIGAIVDVGTCLRTSRRALRLAAAHPRVWAVVGLHPYEGDDWNEQTIEQLERLAREPRVVALGEMGFDFYRDRASEAGQRALFRAQLELAARLDLPVVLHLRSARDAERGGTGDAYAAARRELAHFGGRIRGIAHCFGSDRDDALAMCEAGLHVSFAGNVTYPRNEPLREAARAVPLERLLVETDCPYLAPQPVRGKRNEPAHVAHTARAIAEARGLAFASLARASTANACALFGFEPPALAHG
ncbi:MAG: TatD family deoxyribonuclease [Planctomycetota bacterium]|nr:MAG: TatD family deoxyribonuclease [Planctomycetota bacterium]